SRTKATDNLTEDTFGGAAPIPDSLVFPAPFSAANAFFLLIISGGTSTNLQVGRNVGNVQRQLNLIDNVSLITSSHQLKWGVDYRNISPLSGPRAYNQRISFSGTGVGVPTPPAGSVLSGRASSAMIGANEGIRFTFSNFSAYGQDTWKVNSRINLT